MREGGAYMVLGLKGAKTKPNDLWIVLLNQVRFNIISRKPILKHPPKK